ncbi:MAG: Zn-dependent alcohol dehydrogenase [Dehalococcoidales bacterium]|nr:Zn-dependent alcohol dehydrogenase [Dehalococcoidales bacterium]
MSKMKAAVCYEAGKPLVIEEVEIDPPKKGEVKVKLAATAICHSDIHVFKGEIPWQIPCIGGHESAGYVAEVGEGVTGFREGDPVVVSLLVSCGRCRYCLTGYTHMCSATWPMDTESRVRNRKGQSLAPCFKTGTFAEYTVVDQSQLVKAPKDMPLDRAALLSCGVITGFGAVVNRAKVPPMSSCVIIGAGGVGLNAVQGAAISGAYPVIVVDILDEKLRKAKEFGATHTVNASKEDAVEAVKKLTGGIGADYAFVTVGSVNAIQQALMLTGPRGTTVIVGLPRFGDMLTIPPFIFIKDERTLTGSYMGTTQLHTEIPKLIELYQAGILKLDELITNRYPLEKINEAIAEVEKGKVLRNVIMFT